MTRYAGAAGTKIALTGGNGFVASKVLESSQSAHYLWVVLSRSEHIETSGGHERPANITNVQADYSDISSLADSLRGVDVLIHAAAMVKPVGTKKDFIKANTFATEKLLSAAKVAGVSKFIYISSRSAIGSKPGYQDVNDDFPTDQYGPRQHYGESKYLAERAVQNSGLDYTIIRPTVITGVGDKNFLPGLVSRIRKKKFAFLGNANHKVSFVIVDNLVSLIYEAINNQALSKRTLLSTDSPSVSWQNLVDLAYEEIPDLPKYNIPTIPLSLAKPLGIVMDYTFLCARALTGVQLNLPTSRSIVDYYGSNMTFDASDLRALNFKPPVEVISGLRQALGSLR